MKSAPESSVDVAIVGGGLVGLMLAALLQNSKLSVAVIEARPPTEAPNNADLGLRMSALAPASRALLQRLGVWSELPAPKVSAYERMCVWQAAGTAGSARSISFAADELGEPDLGHIVENEAIRLLLWQRLAAAGSVRLLTELQPAGLEQSPDAIQIRAADGSQLTARLLVGADGAHSWVREQLGVAWHERAYGQAALVAHIASELPHRHTAWQRFLTSGPVALLPLADGRSSLVWSCPEAQAEALKQMSDAEFGAQLTAAFDGVLGQLRCSSPRVSFPLAMGYAAAYTGRRFALLGDAAHRVHPLAGQGVNLGLLDAAALAESLLEHAERPCADPGDPLALRRYERARKGDNLATMSVMDGLQRVFASPLAELAGAGMQWVDGIQPLKVRLANYAMGRGRDLPAAAQPLRD